VMKDPEQPEPLRRRRLEDKPSLVGRLYHQRPTFAPASLPEDEEATAVAIGSV
jgi:hypothetical protein